jgi:hypothetical protein
MAKRHISLCTSSLSVETSKAFGFVVNKGDVRINGSRAYQQIESAEFM